MADGARYDDDFYLWTRDQAERLRLGARAGSNVPLDWENLAEEIESVGRSEQREVANRLSTLMSHLLKLKYSTSELPRRGWSATVRAQRREIKAVFADSPSLRVRLGELRARVEEMAIPDTENDLPDYGEEASAKAVRRDDHSELFERMLDDDYFPHPPEAATTSAST